MKKLIATVIILAASIQLFAGGIWKGMSIGDNRSSVIRKAKKLNIKFLRENKAGLFYKLDDFIINLVLDPESKNLSAIVLSKVIPLNDDDAIKELVGVYREIILSHHSPNIKPSIEKDSHSVMLSYEEPNVKYIDAIEISTIGKRMIISYVVSTKRQAQTSRERNNKAKKHLMKKIW